MFARPTSQYTQSTGTPQSPAHFGSASIHAKQSGYINIALCFREPKRKLYGISHSSRDDDHTTMPPNDAEKTHSTNNIAHHRLFTKSNQHTHTVRAMAYWRIIELTRMQ